MKKGLLAGSCAILAAFVAGAADDFEAKRAEILARPRTMLTDNDGNDFVYYSRSRPVTEEAFIESRIGYVAKTRCETMIYCPWSSGFGNFTVPGIGTTYTNACPYLDTYNPILDFFKIGKDPLQMAIDFCRREKREIFLGIRFNDTHDVSSWQLFPQWKKDHPDCLFGTKEKRPNRCAWSAVDFEKPEVRDYMKDFMRKFFVRYDLDGVEYDFFRHFQLFKTVAWSDSQEASRATEAQLEIMSVFMKELREIADEEGRRRGKPLVVAIRVPDSFEYCRLAGVDLERWLRDRSVDIVIGGGYWQFQPWRNTAGRVHALGAKFYVSMDESRIGWNVRAYPWGILPGRQSPQFYYARLASAIADGTDGVCFFNCQGGALANYGAVDPRNTEGLDKYYFAVERGSGGYTANSWIYMGTRFSKMPRLDPAFPTLLQTNSVYPFEIVVGDDFAKPAKRPPKATANVLMDVTKPIDVRLCLNGKTLGAPSFSSNSTTNGVYVFSVPVADLKRGANAFALETPHVLPSGRPEVRFVDFRLDIRY